MNKTGIIILAAGNSSRLGRAKQLITYNEKTLLRHVIDEAVLSDADTVVVVLGAKAKEILKQMPIEKVVVVLNKDWREGMAESIEAGLKAAVGVRAVDQVIITVTDQPFVSAALFKKLVQQQKESGKQIVASAYADTIGTPVLFTQKYFELLSDLQGDQGAKKIIKANMQDTATVDFPEGNIDIDTEEDLKYLSGR